VDYVPFIEHWLSWAGSSHRFFGRGSVDLVIIISLLLYSYFHYWWLGIQKTKMWAEKWTFDWLRLFPMINTNEPWSNNYKVLVAPFSLAYKASENICVTPRLLFASLLTWGLVWPCLFLRVQEKDEFGNEVTRLGGPLPVEYLLLDQPVSTPNEPTHTFTEIKDNPFPILNRYVASMGGSLYYLLLLLLALIKLVQI
jgi:hypothetical protein